MIRLAKALAAGTALMAVSACVSLSKDPPPSLLILTPSLEAQAGSTTAVSEAGALVIEDIDVPAQLDVMRVPVQVDNANVAYLKDAIWVDKPARLFRGLLGETIRAQTGHVVFDSGNPALRAQDRLRGTLQSFGYDARTGSVVVRFDAIKQIEGQDLQAQRFEAVVEGVPAEAGPVSEALNDAANNVAVQVAAWVG